MPCGDWWEGAGVVDVLVAGGGSAGCVLAARLSEHLYVADASIMPAIPSANTNLPTIMIAERIASWLASGPDTTNAVPRAPGRAPGKEG
jgi:choline dehydrogenase-like flavoprotein